jgi:purine-cytosine permease-like protein
LDTALENFLALIAYWGAVYLAIVSTEHVVFGKKAATYDPVIWNDATKFLLGLAAFLSIALPFALIIPEINVTSCLDPIARATVILGLRLVVS